MKGVLKMIRKLKLRIAEDMAVLIRLIAGDTRTQVESLLAVGTIQAGINTQQSALKDANAALMNTIKRMAFRTGGFGKPCA
jgi:predicted DNA-binding antitoxin AbrB/MazE fold protein